MIIATLAQLAGEPLRSRGAAVTSRGRGRADHQHHRRRRLRSPPYLVPILLAVLGVIFISRAGKGEMSKVLTSSAIAIVGLGLHRRRGRPVPLRRETRQADLRVGHMRLRTDDDIYRARLVYLGPPGYTLPIQLSYAQYGLFISAGAAVHVHPLPVHLHGRRRPAWEIALAMVTTSFIWRYVDPDRPARMVIRTALTDWRGSRARLR